MCHINIRSEWISVDKIKIALESFKSNRSPGSDGIQPVIFKRLPTNVLEYLRVIFVCCIHFRYTPKSWKKSMVIFIPKPGKSSYKSPKSFRPILLSNYFLKCLEKLVVWKMDEALIEKPIHKKQHGFLTKKSTESALSNTVNYLDKYAMQRKTALGVFLDIIAAFDSIQPKHIRDQLLIHGGDEDGVEWYYN